MKTRPSPRRNYHEAHYPAMGRPRGRRLLLCISLVAGTWSQGCLFPGDVASPRHEPTREQDTGGIDGDMAAPKQVFPVALPDRGSRLLEFPEADGLVLYHLELLVRGSDLADFLDENTAELLDLVEEVLIWYDLEDFGPDEDLSAMEDELKSLLANAWGGEPGSSTDDFVSLELVVDTWYQGDGSQDDTGGP